MTYKEQCEIEKLNKQILENIKNTVDPDTFINFYKAHNQKQTMEKFGLRTTKQLTKILEFFNYDFSFKKGLNKGKPSARPHENYVSGGKKSAETQRANWENKSAEEKQAWKDKQKLAHSTAEFKEKIKQINVEYQANLSEDIKRERNLKKSISNALAWNRLWSEKTEEEKQQWIELISKSCKEAWKNIPVEKLNLRNEKIDQTKKINNTYTTSQPEERFYLFLIEKYGQSDIIRQYKDTIRYPFKCDFYIKSEDLFIELNFDWTHGGHLFNPEDSKDLQKLKIWQDRAENKKSGYYTNAITTWTRRDPLKIKTAKENNLNYKVFYTESELFNYFNNN